MYQYSLWDGDEAVACIYLSEIADFYLAGVKEDEVRQRIPKPEKYVAAVSNKRGIRIGSKKRFRGMMIAAGFSPRKVNGIIYEMRNHPGMSYQDLWYKTVSIAVVNKLVLNLRNTFSFTAELSEEQYETWKRLAEGMRDEVCEG